MTSDLIASLSRFAARDNRPSDDDLPDRPILGAFFARDRERMGELTIGKTILVILLDGTKEIADSRGSHRFGKGTALLLPAGWTGTVVNEPDPESGVYRSLVLQFPAEMVRRLLRAHGPDGVAKPGRSGDFRVPLTPSLGAAVLHAAEGLSEGSTVSPLVAGHRCMEVLLCLLEGGAWWLGAVTPTGVGDAVRALLRAHPDRPWTAETVARELNLSTGTLRRRLAEENISVRRVLTDERVAHARHLLENEGLSVQETAEACGYASRSHFARRVRDATGLNPSDLARDGD
ncbi:helix-turn-helix transcriptional regulator [Azospirillum doebereinerae]|uniref:AraC family transcriptional regulator n=1 Tax=Azospirillum doebereinerae TaxID=92933 RepID=A0A433JAN6_9PROT|nr:AraC family transcriptional regulator [Azospirillum doebereinerae]MCG5241148.1 AraC family transcriptional regulator [Azospirillum doebereinerae]RUQ72855.1 AraC family transcriptional regulator [Azospirillum doebereinerae]